MNIRMKEKCILWVTFRRFCCALPMHIFVLTQSTLLLRPFKQQHYALLVPMRGGVSERIFMALLLLS